MLYLYLFNKEDRKAITGKKIQALPPSKDNPETTISQGEIVDKGNN